MKPRNPMMCVLKKTWGMESVQQFYLARNTLLLFFVLSLRNLPGISWNERIISPTDN